MHFKIGDAVIYTNDAGLQFRRRVTGFYRPAGPSGLYALGRRYFHQLVLAVDAGAGIQPAP
ncbi:FIG00582580: hypothetical protein [plant metagenome]|uniref:Uncharacterized protein n=1 Tax=plant metagenome TaxID=1297885 RepID=A0A484P4T4_9ZZZZ